MPRPPTVDVCHDALCAGCFDISSRFRRPSAEFDLDEPAQITGVRDIADRRPPRRVRVRGGPTLARRGPEGLPPDLMRDVGLEPRPDIQRFPRSLPW